VKTVQMTLDEDLVSAVDRAARKLGTSRSAFTRVALKEALERVRARALEQRHREGYQRLPVRRREFSVWEAEQAWVEP
jgi:metal-responsive CopG/Arc/MetJ family transcriptional regulator